MWFIPQPDAAEVSIILTYSRGVEDQEIGNEIEEEGAKSD
jgi:hypothetical protein